MAIIKPFKGIRPPKELVCALMIGSPRMHVKAKCEQGLGCIPVAQAAPCKVDCTG